MTEPEECRMSYDHWKTTEPDDGEERPARGTELRREVSEIIKELDRLRVSRERLVVAAKDLLDTTPAPPTDDGRRVFDALRQAIWDAVP
jgi:hypothetical protein